MDVSPAPEIPGLLYAYDSNGYRFGFKEIALGPRPRLELVEIMAENEQRITFLCCPSSKLMYVGAKFMARRESTQNLYSISYSKLVKYDEDAGSVGVLYELCVPYSKKERLYIKRNGT